MASSRLWLVATVILLTAVPASFAGDTPLTPLPPARAVEAMAARVDALIAARWAEVGVQPAPLADDAEFMRRVYLDLTGCIPTIAEARDFLADNHSNKRRLLVDRLLASPRFPSHLANIFRTMLLPEASSNIIARLMAPSVEGWLRDNIAAGAGYDRIVRELVTLPLDSDSQRAFQEVFEGNAKPKPLGFFVAKDVKPENLAAATVRTFMGIRLECAQCHDHPHAPWTREQFWSQAAFFAGIKRLAQEEVSLPRGEDLDRREVSIPNTDRMVQAVFLDGTTPNFKYKTSPRTTLGEWLTSPNNPYFARAAVNRLWGQFLGTGIVDPVDDMLGNDAVKPSHPELLDELAQQFVVHQFDLKYVIRVITASKAYQLSSRRTSPAQDEPSLFAKASLRGLTPDQLYDSVARAIGHVDPSPLGGRGALVALYGGSPRTEFMTKFSNQHDKATEVETSILQALALMNGKFIANATSLEKSVLLAGVADSPFMTTAERVETLYLATLSRLPKQMERDRLVKYVEGAGTALAGKLTDAERRKNYNRALTDVFWALLNSGEFFLNH